MPLSWVNNQSGTAAGSGALIRSALGAELTAATTITITDSVHVVSGSATITTITTSAVVPTFLVLIPKAASTWSIGTGGNITGILSSVAAVVDRPLLLIWDGSTSWRPGASAALDYIKWTTPTFSAGNYTGNAAMTWTVDAGDVTTFAYTVSGKTMTIAFSIVTTTVAGTPDTLLQIAIPGGFVAAKKTYAMGWSLDNGNNTNFHILVDAAGTLIKLEKNALTAWTAAVNNTAVHGEITFEIQ